MTEPKYIQVPEIEPQGCEGCPLHHKSYDACAEVFKRNGLPIVMVNGFEFTNCNDTRSILIEDTDEARAKYAVWRLQGHVDEE